MKQKSAILLISDNNQDMAEIVSHLEAREFSLKSTANPEAGAAMFKQDKPGVLLLNFHTMDLAKTFLQELPYDPKLHQVVCLCTRQEAKDAAQLVLDGTIDDYFIFRPITDSHYLSLCVYHALEKVAVSKELSEAQIRLKNLSVLLDEQKKKEKLAQSKKQVAEKTEEEPKEDKKEYKETHSVLIVEEDLRTLENLELYLINDYRVYRATNRIMAIIEIQKFPDLILMNPHLSGIGGINMVQRLKRNDRYRHVPIILILEPTETEEANTALQSGIEDVIMKPVDLHELRRKIQYQLDRRKKIKLRTSERYNVQWRVDYTFLRSDKLLSTSKGQQTYILNVSEGGAAFMSLSEVKTEEVCAFAIHVPGYTAPFLVIGEIAWVKTMNDKWICGVKWAYWQSEKERMQVMEVAETQGTPNIETPSELSL